MKNKFLYIVAILAIVPLFWAGEEGGGVEKVRAPLYDTNLVADSGFDTTFIVGTDTVRNPIITGWYLSYYQQQPIFIDDAPIHSGPYSLGLLPVDNINNLYNADYYIKGVNGTNSYTLKVSWKIARKNSTVLTNPSVTVGVYSASHISQVQSDTISNADTTWTQNSYSFSLITTPSDTIIVRLNGGKSNHSMRPESDGLYLFSHVQLIKH